MNKSSLNKVEKEITDYLVKQYQPQVILLAGSRADGTFSKESDWDLFIFTNKQNKGGFIRWNDHLLDITVKKYPFSHDEVITIPYKPLLPAKVLLDNSEGSLNKVLTRTKEVFDMGPLKSYSNGCARRLNQLDRWYTKLTKYKEDENVQFYYAGIAIEFLLRVWFEQRNLWPVNPRKSFDYIKNNDSDFFKLLSQFIESSGEDRILVYKEMLKQLKDINTNM